MSTEQTPPTAPVEAVVIPLPDRATEMTADQAKALAWDMLWNWCMQNGFPEYSFLRQAKYRNLNGPEMVAQWITDLKAERSARLPNGGGHNE